MITNSSLECIAEKLIEYIDARLSGDLDTAYKIKRKLEKKNPAEAMVCHLCKKVSNLGKVIVSDSRLVWECSRCANIEIVRKNTLFNRREGN